MPEPLDTFQIIVGLVGGLALFLFGMEQLAGGLKVAAGTGLKALLARFTDNRFKGAFVGAFVTAVVQSSSVTTVLVVGFISAGLMTLGQSVPVIMGANIGSTVTAQVIAFDIAGYGLIGIAIGFVMQFVGKTARSRNIGAVIIGLGLIFFGMDLMGEATRPLRAYPPFIAAMQRLEDPLFGILVGAAFTALVQSSAATTALVIVLASEGAVTLDAGIILVFGANIGTCITAVLAAVGKKVEARRAAAVHVLFNVVGVAMWIAFVGNLADFVRWMSPSEQGLSGAALLAAETPRQIANAHTIFNVANTLLLIGFVKPMAWLATKVIRARDESDQRVMPRYLDEALLQTPDLALDRVRMELRRVSDRITEMLDGALSPVVRGTMDDLEKIRQRDEDVDILYAEIIGYLSRLSQGNLADRHVHILGIYIQAANRLESIGDVVQDNMFEIGRKRLEGGVQMSQGTIDEFEHLHRKVCWAVRTASHAFDAGNGDMADLVIAAKPDINQIADSLELRLSRRVGATEDGRRVLYQIESELIEYLKRVYYFAKRLAKGTVELHREHDHVDAE